MLNSESPIVAISFRSWTNAQGKDVPISKVILEDGTEYENFGERMEPAEWRGKYLAPEVWDYSPPKRDGYAAGIKKKGGAKGGGGYGNRESSWRNTEPGFRFEQERMDRRTALMQSVASGVAIADIVSAADILYSWLRATSGNTAPVASATTTAAPSGSVVGSEDKSVWAGPGQCPECRAPSGKYHATGCANNDPFADTD